jgi:hypothetical protein
MVVRIRQATSACMWVKKMKNNTMCHVTLRCFLDTSYENMRKRPIHSSASSFSSWILHRYLITLWVKHLNKCHGKI